MIARVVRVAILVPGGDTLPEWAHLAVADLASVPGVSLTVIALAVPPRHGLLEDLVHAYDALDARIFTSPASATQEVKGQELTAASVVVHRAHAREAANALLARASEPAVLDAIVDLTDEATVPAGVPAPALGVWALSHDGTTAARAARAAVLGQRPTIRSVLHTLGSAPMVLYESVTATDHVSPTRAIDRLLWKCVPFAARALRDVLRRGVASLSERLLVWDRIDVLSRWATLASLPRHAARYAIFRATEHRHPPVWVLLAGRGDALHAIEHVRRIDPPAGRFWADPFLVERDGVTYVFFEEFPFTARRGHISVATIDPAGRVSDARVVLQRPYHLSYPFVFEHAGDLFMLPETAANRTVEVYRCEMFPDRWRLHATLMRNVHAVDTTLITDDNRWWMFTNLAPYRGSSNYDELYVFHASSPFASTWEAHPLNPVVSHVAFARPAGALLRDEAGWIRPSQDCSGEYGRAIRLNRIDVLTPMAYRERTIATIEPNWDPDIVATHTLSCLKGLIVLDGKHRASGRSRSARSLEGPRTIHPVACGVARRGSLG